VVGVAHPVAIPATRLSDLGIASTIPYAHPPRVSDAVLAIPEVFVQLDCLNLLRQHIVRNRNDTGYNYSHHPAFKGPQDAVMYRADLCIERLRDAIFCWADLGTILQDLRIDEQGRAQSGLRFDARHQCRDLDAIRDWTVSNAVQSVRMNHGWWGGRAFQ
jgi:hypothetical protein